MTSQTICNALGLAALVYVASNLVVIACIGRENQRLRTHVQNLLDSVLGAYKIIAALAERIDVLERRVALLERAEPEPAPDPDAATIAAVPCPTSSDVPRGLYGEPDYDD